MITIVRKILCFSVEPEAQKKLTRHGSVEIYDGEFPESSILIPSIYLCQLRLLQPDSPQQADSKCKQDPA